MKHSAAAATRLKEILADFSPLPEAKNDGGTLRSSCEGEVLMKLLGYWRAQSAQQRPVLKGVALSRPDGINPSLDILLDPGQGLPVFLLEVDWRGSRPPLDFSSIWPYAAWWEEEVRRFDGLGDAAAAGESGVQWLRH